MPNINETTEQCKERWARAFRPLIGRTIKSVSWMTEAEAKQFDWHRSPIVIELDDGTLLFPSQDDEGNDAGALFCSSKIVPETAPVI